VIQRLAVQFLDDATMVLALSKLDKPKAAGITLRLDLQRNERHRTETRGQRQIPRVLSSTIPGNSNHKILCSLYSPGGGKTGSVLPPIRGRLRAGIC
jgi:hypothetical protein